MDEKDSSRFKIGFDDDTKEKVEVRATSPQTIAGNDTLTIDKLNRKITTIAVAIPLLTVILFIFAYVDINKNVTDIHATGMANFKKLSHDLEKSLSDLSTKSAKLKEMVETETSAFEKKTNLFSEKLNKNAAGINSLDNKISALKKADESKTDLKDFQSYVSKMEKQISSFKSDLTSMKNERKAFRSEMEAELLKLQDTLGNMFEVLQKLKIDMVSLSENQVDKETLNNALQRQHEKYRHELEVVSEKFEKQLSEIPEPSLQSIKPDSTKPEQIKSEQIKSGPAESNLIEKDISGQRKPE